MSTPQGLAAYIAVTAAYWALMLSDGALRMLVLLHFNTLGFSPIQLAYLFVLYELAGVITNLAAGWIAARFGLLSTLYAGLALQIAALIALTQLDPNWNVAASVVFVMAVQAVSGVAKDLTKMSSKSAVKLLAQSALGGLFRWVAILTGSKNAVKGCGFLLGAAGLGIIGFTSSILVLTGLLCAVLIALILRMPAGLPQGKKDAKFRDVLSKNANVNWLSLGRVFLFGARDVWFGVGLPIYFYAVLSDGTPESNRNAFFLVGSFMAVWIILYGAVQAMAPRLLRARAKPHAALVASARFWAGTLFFVPLCLTALALTVDTPASWFTQVLVVGLLAFGALFAINSSLHSYLILAFTSAERVTLDVGFYYMANAAGRLIGTLLSGLSYQVGGLSLCLGLATGMIALSWVSVGRLNAREELEPLRP